MKKNFLLILSVAVLLATISCNKAGKSGLLVPKDAAFVMHINMSSLSSKLSWDEVKQTNWFKEIGQENGPDTLAMQLLNNPEGSGIDLKGKHVLFLKNEGNAGYFAFVGALKDAAAYEKMLVQVSKSEIKVTKEGDLSVGRSNRDNSLVVWNSSTFIVLGDAPMGSFAPGMHQGFGGRQKSYTADSLLTVAKGLLSLSGDALLDSDKRFASLLKENGDLHFWINSEKLAGNSLGGMVSMMKMNTIFENNIGTATLNFDDGKISIKANQYFGKEITDLLKKYEPKNVSSDVINHLPSENVLAAGVFNYPPEGLKAMLKLVGVDGMVNGFLGEVNYTIDDFIKANKGDIAFAINNFDLKTDSVAYEGFGGQKEYYVRREPSIKFVAGVSVNDREAFNKLIGAVSTVLKAEKTDRSQPAINYKLEDKWFVVGSSDAEIASFLTGKNKPAYADKISGHQGGIFVDIHRILEIGQTINAANKDDRATASREANDKTIAASIAFWQNVVAYADIKDGSASSVIEINLVDKTTNSLKQLNKYIDQIATVHKRSEYGPDDIRIIQPVGGTVVSYPAK